MDFLERSIRGIKSGIKRESVVELDKDEVAQKACKDLLDSFSNTFNLFFDTLTLGKSVETVDYIDLIRAISGNNSIRNVTIESEFFKRLNPEELNILLQIIASSAKLEVLKLHFPDTPIPPRTLANALGRTKTLKEIHFYDLELAGDDDDMEPLGEVMEGLSSLKIASFHNLGLEEVGEHQDPPSLDHIVNGLSNLTTLEELSITTKRKITWDDDVLGALLSSDNPLKTLKLKNFKLEDSQVSAIGNTLQTNTSLLYLGLVDCGIDEEGWRSIASSFSDNRTLQHLDFSQTPTLDDDACFVIGSCLEENTGLKVLKMTNQESSEVSSKGASNLFRMLEKNSALECLEVSFSAVDDSGFKSAADALVRNKTLKKLFVENHGTSVSTIGVVAIAKALESDNSTLENIGLVFDGADSDGVVALAQAMQKSPSLKHFAFNRADYYAN